MAKLIVFNTVSLDGYFTDADSDMSWIHSQGKEWDDFVSGNAQGGGILVFGRVTYEMMAGWWPTPAALKAFPAVAAGMNRAEKYVFSKKLKKTDWSNTTILRGDPAEEIAALKKKPGPGLAILGSGSIVSRAAAAGLVDEFQMVMYPIVLGKGKTMFEGIPERIPLKLAGTRAFKNGNVLLRYTTAA